MNTKMLPKLKLTCMLLVSLCLGPVALTAVVGLSGGCAQLDEGADPVVVRAEQTAAGAFELMDAFVQMEFNNRESLRQLSPEIEKAANAVRVDGRKALEELRIATQVYKRNRSAENKATVQTWIATTENLKRLALQHLTSAKKPQ